MLHTMDMDMDMQERDPDLPTMPNVCLSVVFCTLYIYYVLQLEDPGLEI